MLRRSLIAAGGFCLIAGYAAAQSTESVRIRGTIGAVNATSLQITSRAGDQLSVALPAQLPVTAIVAAQISDIKSGTYIGTAAMPQPDGTLRALEVQVFPDRMRGVGEGNHAWDLRPQSTMTNGTATDVVGTEGRTLTLRYKTGDKKLVVPDNVPIITYEPGDRAMLVPGAHVIITADKASSGALTATRVSVGKDGLTPPM
jgi:hypothetical protein